jgi:hypothetical protein
LARDIWNLLESRYLKRVLKKFLQDIKVNKKVFIPRIESAEYFTLDNLEQIPKFRDDERIKAETGEGTK